MEMEPTFGDERSAEEIRERYYSMGGPGDMPIKYRADWMATKARFAVSAATSALYSGDRESAIRMYEESIGDLQRAIAFLKEEQ